MSDTARTADEILQAILDAPDEAECSECVSAAFEGNVFWFAEQDLVYGTPAAREAAIEATRSFIVTMALVRLLRERDGHKRPVAKWLERMAQQPMLYARRFVGSFGDHDGHAIADPAAEAIDFDADRARHEKSEAFFARMCEEARRTGSQCYPVFPEAFIEGFDDDDDNELVPRKFSDGAVGINYDTVNDVLYVKRAGEECRGTRETHEGSNVVLSLDKGSEKVTGVTMIGASVHREGWPERSDTDGIPGDVLEAINDWMRRTP